MSLATVAGVLCAIEPGETITYSELLQRMKYLGLGTAGTGMVLDGFSVTHRWHSRELATWRQPYYDEENVGGWTNGTLWIGRRPAGVDSLV